MHCLYQAKLKTSNNSSQEPILFCFINDLPADSSPITEQITQRIKNHFSSIYLFQYPKYKLSPQLIETLVQEYIQQIRRRQPRGPYYFISYKQGCLFVYELMKQLKEKQFENSSTTCKTVRNKTSTKSK
ncbi:unnamed protein product [Rotaria sp. Silwood2]|nr:unnamed protein product [Rotaria sp. Silwood2]CAF4219736.1 unnamed protein product [Rotaria sp. Silwood2]